jgi:hypothetical protein
VLPASLPQTAERALARTGELAPANSTCAPSLNTGGATTYPDTRLKIVYSVKDQPGTS